MTTRTKPASNNQPVLTIKDSEDNCIECGLQIASQRQIEHPGCCLCQSCADVYEQEADQQ